MLVGITILIVATRIKSARDLNLIRGSKLWNYKSKLNVELLLIELISVVISEFSLTQWAIDKNSFSV